MSKPEIMTLECAGCTAPLSEAIVSTGVYRCPYCGYVNILPKEEQSPEVKHYLYSGDAELKDYAFERAYNAYSKAVELDPKESKAYFGMALSSNRVKYIKDVVNNRWQAICCEVTDRKFCEDVNYLRALDVATDEQKVEYEARAKEIDYIREKFLELKNSGLSYDTFLCVKVSDGEGGFTKDSHWAGKLYDALKKSGASPFYSEREIGDRVGEDYEALILYALYTSKSMVIVCSNEEYLRTPWVQNEYTRYYSMMTGEEKAKNSIMIAFFDHIVERIPTIPGKIQGVDLLGFGGLEQITEFVSKHANAEERARKKAEEKARAEAARKAKEEADEKARQEQQKAIEEQRIAFAKAEEERKAREEADRKALEEQQKMLLELQEKLKKEQEDVKYCKKCGAKNSLNVKFCSECANSTFSKTNEKFCVSCEAVNPISTKFCSSCGKSEFVFAREEIEKVIAQRKAKEEAERIAREKAEEKRKAKEEAARLAREKAEAERKAREEAKKLAPAQDKKSKKPLLFILIALFVVIAVLAAVLIPGLFDDDSDEQSESTTQSESESESTAKPKGDYKYTVSGSTATITKYQGTAAIVEIPTEIDGYVVTEIGANAFLSCANITKITIPSSVTKIGMSAFDSCTSLRSIKIPIGVTSIGISAFNGCTSLESITIPNSVTSIGRSAFYGCTSLKSITIPNSVTSIGNSAFSGCSSLESATISNNLKSITENMFYQCSKLESIYIPYGVTSIANSAFYECRGLKSVTIPNSVTSIGSTAFYGCISLESITLPNNLTSISTGVFYQCTKLTSIEIPRTVTTIEESAFFGCTGLASVTIPDSVTSIEKRAFQNCAALTSVTIPSSVTSIGSAAFQNCTSIEIRCEAESQPNGWDSNWNSSSHPVVWGYEESTDASAFEYTVSDGNATITGYTGTDTEVVIPSEIEGYPVTAIGERAFSNNTSITSVTIPDSVTLIFDGAFIGCSSIASFTVNKNNTAYQSIDGNLYSKDGKILVYYAGGKTDTSFAIPNGVTSIGTAAVSFCHSLERITIPESVTSIGVYAFVGCRSLTSITVNTNNTAYKSVDGNLYSNNGEMLLQYAIGKTDKVFEIPDGTLLIAGHAFSAASSLETVIVPDSVTTMGYEVFFRCDSLTIYCEAESPPAEWDSNWNESNCPVVWGYIGKTGTTADGVKYEYISGGVKITGYTGSSTEIVIPSTINGLPVTSIGEYAFVDCTSLTSVTIPNSVTSIGSSAFECCSSLASITIPDSVTEIGGHAFEECDSLESIFIPNSVTAMGDSVFLNCNSITVCCEAQSKPNDWNADWDWYYVGGVSVVWGYKKPTDASAFTYTISDGKVTITKYAGADAEVIIPSKIEGYPVTTIRNEAFYECTSLESITIPNSVTSIGGDAFGNCTSLKSITVDGNNTAYKSVDGNLYSKDGKTLVRYAPGKTATMFAIPSGVTYIQAYAFGNCTSLANIMIPNSVTGIGSVAFYGCTSLKFNEYDNAYYLGNDSNEHLVLVRATDKTITTCQINQSTKIICYDAFYNCTSLKNIEVPNGVISIESDAFSCCYSLEKIFIPKSVEYMGFSVFLSCNSLTIYFEIGIDSSLWDEHWECGWTPPPPTRTIVWNHTHSYTSGECVCGKTNN